MQTFGAIDVGLKYTVPEVGNGPNIATAWSERRCLQNNWVVLLPLPFPPPVLSFGLALK